MKTGLLRISGIVFLALCSCHVFAQQTSSASAQQSLQRWRESKFATLKDDFGELARYREANANLKPPAAGENRVVFFGDSITDMWKLDEWFLSELLRFLLRSIFSLLFRLGLTA